MLHRIIQDHPITAVPNFHNDHPGNATSVLAVLETFLYDPLLDWRLKDPVTDHEGGAEVRSICSCWKNEPSTPYSVEILELSRSPNFLNLTILPPTPPSPTIKSNTPHSSLRCMPVFSKVWKKLYGVDDEENQGYSGASRENYDNNDTIWETELVCFDVLGLHLVMRILGCELGTDPIRKYCSLIGW